MRIFDGHKWHHDALDPYRPESALRIRPTRWLVLAPLEDAHIVPERSLRKVVDYARELGPLRAARKIGSRWRERRRNEQVCACGIGEIVEGRPDEMGRFVVFFCGIAPPCAERVVVDRRFTRATAPLRGSLQRTDGGRSEAGLGVAPFWSDWIGWHPMSGVDPGDPSDLLERCEALVRGAVSTEVEEFESSPVREVRARPTAAAARKVTIFGWGHHARTQIVPALPEGWTLERVHELDPGLEEDVGATWDTSPTLRADEEVDVVCVAGFHGTHADLAAETLRRGGWAVVEKPAVTTRDELERLVDAFDHAPGDESRLSVLFHKRYGTIAGHLRDDLDGPIDMHATVFEIPLPARHWYNWPTSGGRIVSNGCHWIDQFIWLNKGARPLDATVSRGPRGQLVATLTLGNEAFFSMTLTDRGSARRGTREVVEYRTEDRTARVIDGSSYMCEDDARMIRSVEVHPLEALEAAYATIFERIDRNQPCDDRVSLVRTHEAMLELAELAARQ